MELIGQMSLEDKAKFCSGKDFWRLYSKPELGIPEVMVSDGPHGLRTQAGDQDNLGINDSIKAVCFPAGCAAASSFDRELLCRVGQTLGQEAQAVGVSVVLGPAMNIKRSPLCGRNFEYLSEDPLLAGELAAAEITGIQSQHVGTSPKHFAVNSQEYHRMTSSSNVDERAYREIYLANFETAVKKGHPWTIMNSYNRINGTFACESKDLLTDILRDDWGFDGYVMTDWGAMDEKVWALQAGCDLEMPGPGGQTQKIIDAVKDGTLDEKVLDQAVYRILDVIFRYAEHKVDAAFEYEKDHDLAAEAAENCCVLLKNEDGILPLAKNAKAAFIGQYAEKPRFQGGGSSHINCFRTESALEAASSVVPEAEISYARGFDDSKDEINEALIEEAVEIAKKADYAVIFAGLPDSYESEGYDRKHLRMPEGQNVLIERVAAANPNTIVVLHNGSAIEMPWIGKVKAVLEAYLGGQAVGRAEARILFGLANPSGRLAETFPFHLEDTPCYLTFGGENEEVSFSEGVFVGYRYYSSKNMPVLFPFGYGLSYTKFAYGNLRLSDGSFSESGELTVSVDVTNIGSVPGKEVVQLYIAPPEREPNGIFRPVRELRAFDKIPLNPGESRTVTFSLNARAFAYWNTQLHDWFVESGDYTVEICQDAATVLLSEKVAVSGEKALPYTYTLNTPLGKLMSDPRGQAILSQMQNVFGGGNSDSASEAISDEMTMAMMEGLPLRSLLGFSKDISMASLVELVASLNS